MGTMLTPRAPGLFTAEDYLAFLETRPDDERWQLIDGVAVMMAPPSLVHQRIGYNLCHLLNDALEPNRSDLFALQEVGLIVPGFDDFRPHAGVAVIPADIQDTSFADRFFLAAEVLSDSNTRARIETKRHHYQCHSDNCYVLIIDRLAYRVELTARQYNWQPQLLEGPQARMELPELSFSCRVAELYKGTPLAAAAKPS